MVKSEKRSEGKWTAVFLACKYASCPRPPNPGHKFFRDPFNVISVLLLTLYFSAQFEWGMKETKGPAFGYKSYFD